MLPHRTSNSGSFGDRRKEVINLSQLVWDSFTPKHRGCSRVVQTEVLAAAQRSRQLNFKLSKTTFPGGVLADLQTSVLSCDTSINWFRYHIDELEGVQKVQGSVTQSQ